MIIKFSECKNENSKGGCAIGTFVFA